MDETKKELVATKHDITPPPNMYLASLIILIIYICVIYNNCSTNYDFFPVALQTCHYNNLYKIASAINAFLVIFLTVKCANCSKMNREIENLYVYIFKCIVINY